MQRGRAADLFAVGRARAAAGEHGAAKTFAEFERLAVQAEDAADNANGELVEYYLDFLKAPGMALKVAEKEAARRHDAGNVGGLCAGAGYGATRTLG